MPSEGEGQGLGSIVTTLRQVSSEAETTIDKVRSARREMEGASEQAAELSRSASSASELTRQLASDLDGVGERIAAAGSQMEQLQGQIQTLSADDVGLGALDDLLRAGAVDLADLAGALAGAKVEIDGIVESASAFLGRDVPTYKNNLGELIGEIARGKESIDEIEQRLLDLDSSVTDQLAELLQDLKNGTISAERFRAELDRLRERYQSGDLAALLDQLDQLGQRAGAGLEELLNDGRLDGSI